MDEPTRLRMRRAHLNHSTDCPCGRKLWGNGWRSHARSCPDWLTTYGYPLAEADRQGLRADLSIEQVRDVQQRLGALRVEELPGPQWGWTEYRDKVRAITAEMDL